MTVRLKKKNLQIAIDGPVASGKGIAAFRLAEKLGVLYVYTGAMYRAAAWIGLQRGLDLKKETPLVRLLKKTKIELKKPSKKGRICDVLVNGKDVTGKLFSSRIHWASSQVAIFPQVRKHFVNLQQEVVKDKAVVMEGRDIASRVLPKADLKIYMTSSLGTRAKRRLKDLLKRGEKVNIEEVMEQIKKRDYQDTHRRTDPLKRVPDAWVLDTTGLTIEEEVKAIIEKLKQLDLVETE